MEQTPGLRLAHLLEHEPLTRQAELLLAEGVSACSAGHWEWVRSLAFRAQQDLWIRASDWLGCAVVLMHLGDETRMAGQLELARQYYDRARHIFHGRVAPAQRHNEAVAILGLGLLDLQMGFDEAALESLERAQRLLTQARQHWAAVADVGRVLRSDRLREWLEALTDGVAAQCWLEFAGRRPVRRARALPRRPALPRRREIALTAPIEVPEGVHAQVVGWEEAQARVAYAAIRCGVFARIRREIEVTPTELPERTLGKDAAR